MQVFKMGRALRTGALVVLLLGLLLPSPAATQRALPLSTAAGEPALCQFPAPSAGEVSVLNAVASVPYYSDRPAHNTMWAVGYKTQQALGLPDVATLTLYFNGRTWQVVPSPNAGAENVLTGVAAYSANDVWAVGHSYDGFQYNPLLLHFDGAAWQPWTVPLPAYDWVGPWHVRLTGIKILSRIGEDVTRPQPDVAAVAVGYGEHLGTWQPLAFYYDGTAWKILVLPASMTNGRFYAVAGESLNDLWVVGTLDEEGQQVAYLFHHTADGWTPIVKGWGKLTGLAVTADRVFTVGQVQTFTGMETLVMAYTLTTGDWVQVKSFNKPDGDNVLTAITTAGDKVYAVGYTTVADNDVGRQTLVLAYDGVSFAPVAAPNPDQVSELHGAVVHYGVLWAVGSTGHGAQRATLVLNNNCMSAW
jgi:hypothetical protein